MAWAAIKATTSRSPPLLHPISFMPIRSFVSKLFVGGLSFHTTETNLAEAFSQYGQVVEAKIIMENDSNKSKGFGFVTFSSGEESEKAIEEMDGKVLDGRVIRVGIAKANQFADRGPFLTARGPLGYEPTRGRKTKRKPRAKKEKPKNDDDE